MSTVKLPTTITVGLCEGFHWKASEDIKYNNCLRVLIIMHLSNQVKAHPTFNYKSQYFIVNYEINQNQLYATTPIK